MTVNFPSALLLNFEDRFEKVPIEERKLLVKKVISKVTIDRERNVARFLFRRLPAVTPEIEALYQNKKALTEVVSARSSGGGTDSTLANVTPEGSHGVVPTNNVGTPLDLQSFQLHKKQHRPTFRPGGLFFVAGEGPFDPCYEKTMRVSGLRPDLRNDRDSA